MTSKRPKYLILDYPWLPKELRVRMEKYDLDMKEVYLKLFRAYLDCEFCDDYYNVFEEIAKKYGLLPGTHDYRDVLFLGRDIFIGVHNSMPLPIQAHLNRPYWVKDITLDSTSMFLELE